MLSYLNGNLYENPDQVLHSVFHNWEDLEQFYVQEEV